MLGRKKPHATISQNPERKRLEFRKLSQGMPALVDAGISLLRL
jgi:hypothetical protein